IGDEADRIGTLDVTNIDVRQVASRQIKILIDSIGNDQHVIQTHTGQLVDKQLGLGAVDGEVFHDDQALGAHQLTEDGAHRCAVHLLVELLIVILRACREGHTTATPDRTARSTGTRATGALLAPRTLATTGHIGASLLLLAALTTASHVGDDCLMHQRLVELTTKGTLGDFYGLCAINIQLHENSPLPASLDGRTHDDVTTGGTRHCALDQQQVTFGIDTHDFQRLHGYALGAHVSGHLLALENTTRSLALANR